MTGCDGGNRQSDSAVAAVNEPTLSNYQNYNPKIWPRRETSPAVNDDIELRITQLLSKMSLEEKVGQIVQPELRNVTADDVREYHLGSVLNGGGTTPNNDKYATVDDWVNQAEQFYSASMDTSDGKIAIPLIWGSDAIHGNNNLLGATLFPHNIGLGAANDAELVEKIGVATALEVAATGVNWTFGPTVAVVRDVRWGRTYESYSEDPKIVADYARAMVKGIQGDASDRSAGVYAAGKLVATAKHFIGDGGTTQGIDRGDTAISEEELFEIHGAGYIAALDSGVLTTMASFNSWNDEKLHGHNYLLTDILKRRMGFDGLVVSDWNGHRHLPGCSVHRCAAAINAGIDMVMVPQDWKAFYKSTLSDVRDGKISIERLNDAVTRVLRVKLHAGLFDAGEIRSRPFVGDTDLVGSAEHRAIAREAVRKSLVLLKNNNALLPLSAKSNVLVAGDAANNIGKQSGGWSVSWQGTGNTNRDFPGGTSIFAGLQKAINEGGGVAHLDEEGNWDNSSFPAGSKPDVAIVVFGEEPYAEWHGDIANIEYQYGTKRDLALLKSLSEKGIPVVSVFISGRPLWVNKEINASDAFVAAWLPGTEGAGIADLLIHSANNTTNYDFQGRLSFSWPNLVTQAKLNTGQADYQPLFAYGYGLNYTDSSEPLGTLTESNLRQESDQLEEAWVFVSREISPWNILLKDEGQPPVTVSGNTASSGVDTNLTMSSIDHISQEDARQIIWKGIRTASASFVSEYPQDLSDYLTQDASLEFSLKVNQPITADVDLSVSCVEPCSNPISLTEYLSALQLNRWEEVSIPLNCLVDKSVGMSQVTDVFTLTSSNALDLSLGDIKLVPGGGETNVVEASLSCN